MAELNFGKTVTLAQASNIILSTPMNRYFLRGEPGIGKSSLLKSLSANLPDHVVKKLNLELNKVLATPEFAEQMANEAMTLMPMSPQQFENYIKDSLNNNISKRLKSNCYGKINYEDEIKEIWKKKLTLKYIT